MLFLAQAAAQRKGELHLLNLWPFATQRRLIMKKRFALFGLFLFMGLSIRPARAMDYSMENGVIKETGQQSEAITYGSFRAGAYRDAYDVPVNYGTFIAVTPAPGGVSGAIFWFQDDQGNLRNVEINDVTKPIIIHRQGTVAVVQ
jgi:hypothetical protein